MIDITNRKNDGILNVLEQHEKEKILVTITALAVVFYDKCDKELSKDQILDIKVKARKFINGLNEHVIVDRELFVKKVTDLFNFDNDSLASGVVLDNSESGFLSSLNVFKYFSKNDLETLTTHNDLYIKTLVAANKSEIF